MKEQAALSKRLRQALEVRDEQIRLAQVRMGGGFVLIPICRTRSAGFLIVHSLGCDAVHSCARRPPASCWFASTLTACLLAALPTLLQETLAEQVQQLEALYEAQALCGRQQEQVSALERRLEEAEERAGQLRQTLLELTAAKDQADKVGRGARAHCGAWLWIGCVGWMNGFGIWLRLVCLWAAG